MSVTEVLPPQEPSAAVLVLRRLLGGTVGGVLQALSSHPLDTVKSRIQTGQFPTITTAIQSTLKEEGIRGFYRGVTPPLCLNGMFNALLFGLNQQMNNIVTPADHPKGEPLPLWRVAVAGQMTAPIYTFIMTPMEVVKVKLQTQKTINGKKEFTGPINCLAKTFATHGTSALFVGYTPMMMSRVVGLPFYFGSYHTAKQAMIGQGFSETSIAVPMCSGVAAGIPFWCSNYPFDFIKTTVQSHSGRLTPREAAKMIYKRGGVSAFYKGFGVCLLRSIPANSTVWVGVEYTSQFMKSNGW